MTKLSYVSVIKLASNFVNFSRCSSRPLDSFVYVCNGIRKFSGRPIGLNKAKVSDSGRKEAQAALLDYLHSTRGLRFADAQSMSINTRFFLDHLLDQVEIKEQEVGKSVARFLRYHPINEFEPFFESLGLRPCEISPLLPRNLTFLSDDQSLLDNYYALCDFGIPRNKIGKIYENSRELFQCDPKTLALILQACSKLGFSRPFFPLFLSSSPLLLSDRALRDIAEVMNIIRSCGIETNWVEEHFEGSKLFNWSRILRVLQFLTMNGYTNQRLGLILKEHPEFLFYKCGDTTLSLVSFLSKFGLNLSQISATLLQLTDVHIELFYRNLRRFFVFFGKIDMDAGAVGQLFRSQTQTLGCCKIKRARTLMKQLNIGKSRLKRFITEDPEILKQWAVGIKVNPQIAYEDKEAEKLQRMKFLTGIGYEENSPEIRKLMTKFQGQTCDLQERFDFLTNAGISREDVCSMIKRYPQIICQTIDVLQSKLNFVVEELKYPLSELLRLPACLCYAPERIKLRLSMYELHKTVRRRKGEASIVTVISCTDDEFVKRYVRNYPNGMLVWENLKHKFYVK